MSESARQCSRHHINTLQSRQPHMSVIGALPPTAFSYQTMQVHCYGCA